MAVYAIYICPWVSTVCVRNAFLKWSSRYLTVYVGAQNGCLMCVYVRILLINVISTSSTFAVAGKELVEQHLKCLVLGHDVVLAQVMTAGGAGVYLRSE